MADRPRFRGTVRFFRPERGAGLAVVDIPNHVTAALGGLKQMRVKASWMAPSSALTRCPQVAACWRSASAESCSTPPDWTLATRPRSRSRRWIQALEGRSWSRCRWRPLP